MSNSRLTIGQLHSHFRSPTALDERTIGQWHEALGEVDSTSLVDQLVGPDEWLLIRQLDLTTKWRRESTQVDVGHRWSSALSQAIEQAASTPGHPDVVHYASRRQSLADLIYRSALGESQRQWAWHRMGWIERADQHPDEVLHQGLSRLLTEPDWIWPALNQWVHAEPRTGALTALLRAVPPSWWSLLFMRSPNTAAYAAAAQSVQRGDARVRALDSDGHAHADHDGPVTSDMTAPIVQGLDIDPTSLQGPAQALWQWLCGRAYLAERHAPALSVLLASLVWPGRGLGGSLARQRITWAREVVQQAALMQRPLRRDPEQPSVHMTQAASALRPTTSVDSAHLDAHPSSDPASVTAGPEDDGPVAPELPDAATWQSTAWAGALFWLRLIGEAGVLDEVQDALDQTRQGSNSHRHIDNNSDIDHTGQALLTLARVLGVPDDDPMQRAMVGGHWSHADDNAAAPPLPNEWATWLDAWARRQATAWSAWLDEHAPDLPEPRLQSVCHRPGRLRFEPGWIELHLPLDRVDTRIRRLGLDLDPGHLPWLGCVLKICYD